jgi:hypothetical protein
MIDWQGIRQILAEQDARDIEAVYHQGWADAIRWAASTTAQDLHEYAESLGAPLPTTAAILAPPVVQRSNTQ